MNNSSTFSFTNLFNSPHSSSSPQNPNSQQNPSFSPIFSMSYPPHQFFLNFQPHPGFPNFNPFGAQAGFQQSSSYHGVPFHGSFGVFHSGNADGPSSPVGSAALFGAGGGSGSRGDEYSPVSSPTGPADNTNKRHNNEEWSDVESDEGMKGARKYWSKTDNERLINAWLNNSVDSIDGNSKKGPRYWKDVAAKYNKGAPKGQKRTAIQCKNHWNTTSTLVSKFHGCWTTMKNTYASGQSDEQLMEKAQAEYKKLMQTDKPFAFDYWWNAVKDEPKWLNRDVFTTNLNKRNKGSTTGAYTSSNRDIDEGGSPERPRPLGQKQAKAQRKGKAKGKGSLTDENVEQFNVLQAQKKNQLKTWLLLQENMLQQ